MAIYIDGIQLQPKKDGTSLERKYFQEREEIKILFDKFRKGLEPVTLIFKREFTKKWNQNKTSHRGVPPLAMPLVSPYYDDQLGAMQVRYSTSPPRKEGGRLFWLKGVEIIDETFAINENSMDLAWFMLKASTFFQNGVLKLVDLGVEIEAKWDSLVIQTDVAKVLLSNDLEEGRLAKIFALFQDAKYTYDVKDSVSANAMKLWQIAMSDVQAGEGKTITELRTAINKTTPKEDQNKDVVEVEGKEYPVQQTPDGWKKDTILKEAERYAIELPKRVMSNDALYTILQAKIGLLNK